MIKVEAKKNKQDNTKDRVNKMGYKMQTAFKKSKASIIISIVLWIILAIVLVAPIAYASGEAKDGTEFIEILFSEAATFTSITRVFSKGHANVYFKILGYFSLAFWTLAIIGIIRARPKHEYSDIEHGSSDWSEGGEQYKILSKHKGIILAQDNYLPVDKRGNVNVLVVGRFWFW